MPRADLHSVLVCDREIYDASQVDPSLLDPVIRPVGGLPGPVRPFVVVREYQGPQGSYGEHFTIADRTGREVARSRVHRIALSGEMFEDRFVTTLSEVVIDNGDDHTATFFVNDEEVASVPVFVEAARGGDPWVAAQETFNKALKKGAIVWLTVPQPVQHRGWGRKRTSAPQHTQPVWFVLDDGKVYVLNGPTEQQVPHLLDADEVIITARSKDLRSKVAEVRATVDVVPKDEERWERIARTGMGKRLNLPDGDGALERWRNNCTLVELTPRFKEVETERERPAAAAEAAAAPGAPAAAQGAEAAAKPAEEEIKVEAEIDQEVFDRLIAEGKPERVARAKAKAAFVRREKARLRAEREGAEA